MADMQFKPAARKRVKAKVALIGASGSGKTLSGLLFARGLVGDEGRVAVIDTENDTASNYEGSIATKLQPSGFDVLNLTPPFEVDRYIAAMRLAKHAGYDVAVVDQISWMWDGPGGLLEKLDKLSQSGGKGESFYGWKKITPEYNRFVQELLLIDMHVIATMRAKSVYADEDGKNGKRQKVKIGTAPIQRPGLDFEFQIAFDLDAGHCATVNKDRTDVFADHMLPLTIEDGKKLASWLNSAKADQLDPHVVVGASDTAVLDDDQRHNLLELAQTLKLEAETMRSMIKGIASVDSSRDFPTSKLDALRKAMFATAGKKDEPAAEGEKSKRKRVSNKKPADQKEVA